MKRSTTDDPKDPSLLVTEMTIMDGQYQLSLSVDNNSPGPTAHNQSWPSKMLQFVVTFQMLQIIFAVTLILLLIFVLHRLNHLLFSNRLSRLASRNQPLSAPTSSATVPTISGDIALAELGPRPVRPVSKLLDNAESSKVECRVSICQIESGINTNESSGGQQQQGGPKDPDGHSLMSIGSSITGIQTISDSASLVQAHGSRPGHGSHNCLQTRCPSCRVTSEQRRLNHRPHSLEGHSQMLKSYRFWQQDNSSDNSGNNRRFPLAHSNPIACPYPNFYQSQTNSDCEQFEQAIEQSFQRLLHSVRT